MPPEMSFGRSVRYRRTKLGLSQTRLGELVGRSAAAVRSWERDSSIPSDPSVLEALSAVLGIEQQVLFDKAGLDAPAVETSPTVEEALGTLTPTTPSPAVEQDQGDAEISVDESRSWSYREDPSDELISVGFTPIPPHGDVYATRGDPAFSSPVDPFVLTVPAPPTIEPSYMDDESQRQMYRIRNLSTLVLAVALIVLLFWALGNGWEELNTWWDDFFGQLRL